MSLTQEAARTVESSPLLVRDGWIYVYHVFDIADAIDLRCVERVLKDNPSAQRIKFRRSVPRSIQLSDPPVEFSLGAWQATLCGRLVPTSVSARVYSFGAVSISQRLQVDPLGDWDRWLAYSIDIQGELFGTFAQAAARSLQEVQTLIGLCVERPTRELMSEDYVIFYVKEFTAPILASELPRHFDIPRLLLAEHSPISDSERHELDEYQFSYAPDELIVLDWNSAFIYDHSGSQEVPDILGYATTQLLELRFYDAHLDLQLQRIYREISVAHPRAVWMPLANRYTALTRQILALVVEVTDLTDKIENSLKIIGDAYYSRVYVGAVKRFRLGRWRDGIERKLSRVGQIYGQLNDHVTMARSITIELAVLILIAFEVILEVYRWLF